MPQIQGGLIGNFYRTTVRYSTTIRQTTVQETVSHHRGPIKAPPESLRTLHHGTEGFKGGP